MDLAQELAILTRIRRSLASSDAAGALRALDEYEQRFVQPQLEPEALALRVETLADLGRVPEARAVADRLLKGASGQAYATRVRAALEGQPGSAR